MKFSVIIATRNRSALLPRSLRAVTAQTFSAVELIVIDDSTTADTRRKNESLVAAICPGASYLPMPEDKRGRGPSWPRNHAIGLATGDYVAFLDDDDEWIDAANLATVAQALERFGFDVHFADQEAVLADGETCPGPIWTEDLGAKLPAAGLSPEAGSYRVPVDKMLLSGGCAHLNTTVVRRSLLQDGLGGFDVGLAYEEDKEFYYRLLDQAGSIGYTPRLVARHHVPAGAHRPSASTNLSDEDKDTLRLRYLGKLIETARLEPIRERSRRERLYTLKRMAQREAGRGNLAAARRYGAEALRAGFGYKWAGYMGWIWLRSRLAPRPRHLKQL